MALPVDEAPFAALPGGGPAVLEFLGLVKAGWYHPLLALVDESPLAGLRLNGGQTLIEFANVSILGAGGCAGSQKGDCKHGDAGADGEFHGRKEWWGWHLAARCCGACGLWAYLRAGALSRPPPEGSPVLLGQPAEALMPLRGGLFPRPPPDLPPVLLGAFSKKLCMFKPL